MPSSSFLRKQRSTLCDGSLHEIAEHTAASGAYSKGFGPLVVYSVNAVKTNTCDRPAQSNLSVPDGNSGTNMSSMFGKLNGRNLFNGDLEIAPCLHLKYNTIVAPLGPWKTTICLNSGLQTATPQGVYRPSPNVVATSKAMELPPSDVLRPLCDEAFNRFHTMFPEEVSIANFIYELKEIGGLIPTLSKSIRKTIAGGYLNLEFGWKPLIGDISAMLHALDRLDARLKWLRSTYKKKTRVGYSTSINWKPSGVPGYEHRLNAASGLFMDNVITDYSAKFTAGGRLYHQMEDLAQFHGGVRALLGTFGFLNPAKIAWNMVPYSFVLGWFTNIEGLIDRYGNMQQLATDWRVDRMTHSVKTRCTIDIYQANRLGSRTLFRDRLGSAVVEVYKRETGLSVSDSILTLSAPSTKQSALLAALVAGRNY